MGNDRDSRFSGKEISCSKHGKCRSNCTSSCRQGKPLTMDVMDEALALVKALAPKEAPADAFMVKGVSGLKIMKNDMLPEDTIMVSKRLFDLIYESSRT